MKYLLFIIILAAISLSCHKGTSVHVLHPAAGGMNYGGTYRINMVRGNPNGLDPVIISSKLADDIALQIFDRLITFDSLLNIKPELATQWEITDGGKLYTFHLRTDVFFHDDACFPQGKGRRMVAQDVVYSLNRCCDPRTRSAAFWVFKDKVIGANQCYDALLKEMSSSRAAYVEGIKATDDSTLTIRLSRPYAPFIMQLANALGCVVPAEAVKHYGNDFFRHPVGTGAFVFDTWRDDQEMILRRNPRYWQHDEHGNRLPYLDTLVIGFVRDDKVQHQEFMAGKLEESFTIPTEMFNVLFDPQTRQPRKDFGFVIQQRPAMLSWFVDFLCTKAPFNNADVRRAFACAVDKEKIVRYVLRNAPYQPGLYGITPPVMPGYDISDIPGFEFNPRKAQEYLAKAGYANGHGFPEVTFSIYPEPRLQQVAEAVQGMLEENLNIRVKLEILQFSKLLDEAEGGRLLMWGTRWYGDYPDVENYISLWDGSLVPTDSNQPSNPNSTRYNNPVVNSLLTKAVATESEPERLALYKQAETAASVDAPALMLFYENHYRLLQPYIRNYPLDAMNRVLLKHAWFAW